MLNEEKLTDRELELYTVLRMSGRNVDVFIRDIHAKLYGDGDRGARTPQQRLGALISRINRKLDGERIVPGELKKTYRLIATK